ncbi:MAG: ABC transporter substrate-binding protein [Deltaproteobacteria bacterium]|nr:ABC transporter substrate-binding protein [Deltaproteobacteria bacterium]
MRRCLLPLLSVICAISLFAGGCTRQEDPPIGVAVEFMDHAAAVYIALDKEWFKEEGLRLSTCESYVTGMALASSLARGDIQVAYICLVPAINAFANANVGIRIVAGTHRYGYGLVVNPETIRTVKDLEKPWIRIGCVREGGSVDILLHKTMDTYGLDPLKILSRVQRMPPPKQVLAVKMGRLDAAFLPEQWATLAETFGFRMLLTARDIWPRMQGSVLVVKEALIREHPEIVSKLVKVTQRATDWIRAHPNEAAAILARRLSVTEGTLHPAGAAQLAGKMTLTPEILFRSMARMEYTTELGPETVQEVINQIVGLGYIKDRFKAEDILNLSFR